LPTAPPIPAPMVPAFVRSPPLARNARVPHPSRILRWVGWYGLNQPVRLPVILMANPSRAAENQAAPPIRHPWFQHLSAPLHQPGTPGMVRTQPARSLAGNTNGESKPSCGKPGRTTYPAPMVPASVRSLLHQPRRPGCPIHRVFCDGWDGKDSTSREPYGFPSGRRIASCHCCETPRVCSSFAPRASELAHG
jgi:hypothetical protein